MVQTTQRRATRPNPQGPKSYQGEILPEKNSGTVATLDRQGDEYQKGAVFSCSPRVKGESRKDSFRKDRIRSRTVQQAPPPTETMKGGLKLHLGSGGQNWEGFVNIDAYPAFDVKPDVVSNIINLPYEENTVDEIWLIHVFEHLYIWDAQDALEEWHKILKPGGKLVIEVPCMDKIIANYIKKEKDARLTIMGIFGDQIRGMPEMVHKWCYTVAQLIDFFEKAGFKAEHKDPIYHIVIRDMRIIGVKPCHMK